MNPLWILLAFAVMVLSLFGAKDVKRARTMMEDVKLWLLRYLLRFAGAAYIVAVWVGS